MTHLEDLNKKQKEAVLCTDGPVLILAGAGAGKTKTLTHRILNIIKKGIAPEKILAITFTNKAAKEMKERVESLLSKDKDINRPISEFTRPFISTFHSLGVHMLREQCIKIGLPRHFSIYDRNDSKQAIKNALKKLDYDPKEYEPAKILSIISREKGNIITQEEYEADSEFSYMKDVVSAVWREYDLQLKKEKALDFDDLLLETVLMLKKNEEILQYYQSKWSHIHIDEYQDTNEVQYELAKMLTQSHHNICVVGDIDQNIYSWRGATIKNILNFETDYPETTQIVLEQNYRSTQTILTVANRIIEKNVMRKEKKLFTENEEGQKITLYNAFNEGDEAFFVGSEIFNLIRNGVDPKEIAILYRANFQSRVLEEAFLQQNIPYQVLGVRFFDRKEIKDVLSLIKSALNPSDLTSLSRIVNVPPRGIGKITLLKIMEGKENELSGNLKEKFLNFRKMLLDIKDKIETEKPSEIIKFVLDRSGLMDYLKGQREEGEERLENVKELVTLASKYDTLEKPAGLEKLLEDAALATDQDEMEKDNGGVKLMTIHASKGLEFDYVFITGLEAGLFPHEKINEAKEDSEEERRLFYVALTRARKKIYLTYAGIRTIFGAQQVNVPSEFIEDIDSEFIETPEGPDEITRAVKGIFIDF